jgi:hypothetical protein
VNGTLDVHIDNHGIIADPSTTTFTPIDLQGKMTKSGTVLNAPNNYYSIQAPIHVDGTYAGVNIQGGDGLKFYAVQGSGPAGTGGPGIGNRGQAVFQEGGTITLNNGSTLYATGMQMDSGSLNGYSNVNTGNASAWYLILGSGNFYLNGTSTINMGGTNNGDYGSFNVTAAAFQWWHGTLSVGGYSGGGANNGSASQLKVAGNISIAAAPGSGQTIAWAANFMPNSPATYYVMLITVVGDVFVVGTNPAVPANWTGSLVTVNGVVEYKLAG